MDQALSTRTHLTRRDTARDLTLAASLLAAFMALLVLVVAFAPDAADPGQHLILPGPIGEATWVEQTPSPTGL